MSTNSLAGLQAEFHSISGRIDGLRDMLAKFDILILEFTKLRAESVKQTDDISCALELALERLGDVCTQGDRHSPEHSAEPPSTAAISTAHVSQEPEDHDRTSNAFEASPDLVWPKPVKLTTRSPRPLRRTRKPMRLRSDSELRPVAVSESSPEDSPVNDADNAGGAKDVDNADGESTIPDSSAELVQPRRSLRVSKSNKRHDERSPVLPPATRSPAVNDTGEPGPKSRKIELPSKGGKVVLYSQEEDDIILETVQAHLSEELIGQQLFEIVGEELKKRGFHRSRAAIKVRWYTKLQRESSIRLNETRNETRLCLNEKPKEPDTPAPEPSRSITDSGPPKHVQSTKASLSRRLMSIRMGSSSADCRKSRSLHKALKEEAGKHFVLTKTWTGASNDVIDVSWSPDGVNYISCSAAQEDEYNRANNLMLGSMAHNRLLSLPDHRHRRMQNNSSALADPWIYDTVSTVRWSSRGIGQSDLFMSAGFDGTVKQWHFSPTQGIASCELSYDHDDRVITMDTSAPSLGLFATGTTSEVKSLRWYSIGDPVPKYIDLTNRRARSITDGIMCVRFGSSSQNMNYLAAGFSSHTVHHDRGPSTSGYLGLWRFDESRVTQIEVAPNIQQVFDIAWSASNDRFVTGQSRRRRAHNPASSVIRLYSAKQENMLLEFGCEAADINEVGFCPFGESMVTASCTNGITYVWDTRRADRSLHTLHHDRVKFDDLRNEEDTGVRILQWARSQGELYTGGSDGKLVQWDVRRSPEDVYVETVLDSGLEMMSGSLSPSMNELLIGDSAGSIHLLERSPCLSDEAPIQLELFDETMLLPGLDGSDSNPTNSRDEDEEGQTHQGRDAARQLLESGIIEMHPDVGPVQGPKYKAKSKQTKRGTRTDGLDQAKDSEIERTKKLIFKFTQDRNKRKLDATLKDSSSPNNDNNTNNTKYPRWKKAKLHRHHHHHHHDGQPVTGPPRSMPTGEEGKDEEYDDDDDDDNEESENYFPPYWVVDANIETYRSET